MIVLPGHRYRPRFRGSQETIGPPAFFTLTLTPRWCVYTRYKPKAWWVRCHSGAKLMTQADLAGQNVPLPSPVPDKQLSARAALCLPTPPRLRLNGQPYVKNLTVLPGWLVRRNRRARISRERARRNRALARNLARAGQNRDAIKET